MGEIDPDDVKALRAMPLAEWLERGLAFMEHARQFKIVSVRVHHPGWSEEKVMNEVRRWVRGGLFALFGNRKLHFPGSLDHFRGLENFEPGNAAVITEIRDDTGPHFVTLFDARLAQSD